MKLRRAVILFFLSCAFGVAAAQTTPRSQIEAAIDPWSDRAGTREQITKITHDPVPVLAAIAKSNRQPEVRGSHAIALLATFKVASSERVLNQLVDHRNSRYRCLALQSLAELKARGALPVLVRKLDDQAVCVKITATDPAREHGGLSKMRAPNREASGGHNPKVGFFVLTTNPVSVIILPS